MPPPNHHCGGIPFHSAVSKYLHPPALSPAGLHVPARRFAGRLPLLTKWAVAQRAHSELEAAIRCAAAAHR